MQLQTRSHPISGQLVLTTSKSSSTQHSCCHWSAPSSGSKLPLFLVGWTSTVWNWTEKLSFCSNQLVKDWVDECGIKKARRHFWRVSTTRIFEGSIGSITSWDMLGHSFPWSKAEGQNYPSRALNSVRQFGPYLPFQLHYVPQAMLFLATKFGPISGAYSVEEDQEIKLTLP